MFFYISKILYFLILPFTWAMALLLYSIISKNLKRKRITLIISLSILFFFSNSFILDEFMRAWEIKATSKDEIKEPFEYGIVMGGMISFDSQFDRVNFVQSADRLMQALELYGQKKIKKILITSGAGSLQEPELVEALMLKKYLLRIGIPEQDIVAESVSRNTHENAVCTAKLLIDKKSTYLLITSAYHMRRSLGCFRKEGIKVLPYVTDRYAGPRKFYPDHILLPNVQTMEGWNVLFHEWIGYISYKISGYL